MATVDDLWRQPKTPATQSGGAVFGMYPQLADNTRTSYATGARLRSGVSAAGPASFPQAAPATPLAAASPTSLNRMDATSDPRSLLSTPPAGPVGRVSSMVNPSVTAESQMAQQAQVAPTGNSADAAPTTAQAALQTPKFGTASQPVNVGASRGNALAAPPASQALGFGGVQKTVGPDGRTLYSDGNAASDASLMNRGQISAQNMSAADALSSRNDGFIEARAAANRGQYEQEVAQAQAINSRPFAGSGGSLGIRRAPGIASAEQASIDGLNRARGADPFSRKLALGQREQDQALQIANQREAGANARALMSETGQTQRTRIESAARAGAAPTGYRQSANGNLEPIPGGPADQRALKPLTEDQAKSAGYAVRMEDALKTMRQVETENPGATRPGIGTSLINTLPESVANVIRPEARQRVEAAQLDALDAALTLATGAAYTREQLNSLSRSYFAQPNDGDKTVQEKQARLDKIVETARLRAGPTGAAMADKLGGGAPKPTAKAVTRTGTINGRKVTQFADGSIDYAD